MLLIAPSHRLCKYWCLTKATLNDVAPTTDLGGMSANLMRLGRRLVIVGVFTATRLPIIVPALPPDEAVSALRQELRRLLLALNIYPSIVTGELRRSQDWRIGGKTDAGSMGLISAWSVRLADLPSEMDLRVAALRLARSSLPKSQGGTAVAATQALFAPRLRLVNAS